MYQQLHLPAVGGRELVCAPGYYSILVIVGGIYGSCMWRYVQLRPPRSSYLLENVEEEMEVGMSRGRWQEWDVECQRRELSAAPSIRVEWVQLRLALRL